MIKPGDIVTKVEVIKSNNCGDDTGVDGYDVCVKFGEKEVNYIEYQITDLDDKVNGIYHYDGKKYIQIENHE